jgi:hypothetical protein
MRNVTRALVVAIVASLVAVAGSVYAQTPTAADFDGDVPDPGPRVQPCAEGVGGAVVGGQWQSGESYCCPDELAALIKHATG